MAENPIKVLSAGGSATPFAARLSRTFEREAVTGLALAARVRTVCVALIILWSLFDRTVTGGAFWWQTASIFVFFATGLVHIVLTRGTVYRRKAIFALFAVEICILSFLTIMPSPFIDPAPTPQMMMRFVVFYWALLFILHAAFASDPVLLVWTGIWVFITRAAQIAYAALQPGVITDLHVTPGDYETFQLLFFDRDFLFLFQRIGDLIFVAVVTAIGAALVVRSRRLVVAEALSERTRAQLARYVPTTVVDEIAAGQGPFRAPERRHMAIAAIDIVGFTRLCETLSAQEIVNILRDYNTLCANAVFARSGAIDKFIGDGIMATFGFARGVSDPANAALAAMIDFLDKTDVWNAGRRAAGKPEVRFSVGLDSGPAIIGNIGTDLRLELAVLGDPVNTAFRVEDLTRQLQTRLVATGRFVDDLTPASKHASKLRPAGPFRLHGKEAATDVYTL